MPVQFDPFSGQLQIVPYESPPKEERLSVIPVGAINSVNKLFTLPVPFSQVGVYLNGVRLLASSDYVAVETGALGTGFNAVLLTSAPDSGVVPDVVSCDYVTV